MNNDTPESEPTRDPDPKIYAPLISILEADYPELAKQLIGIGDAPVPYDVRKVEVTARFQTEAGTPFSGKYHTEPSTSHQDAKEFAGVMAKKCRANTVSDKAVLESPATVPGPLDRPSGAVARDGAATLADGTPVYSPESPPGDNPPEKPTDAGGAAEGEYTPPPGSPEEVSANHPPQLEDELPDETGRPGDPPDEKDEDWDDPTKTEHQ
jgi:hypothetical protein